MSDEYWEECIASSFDENGIKATPDQITAVASDIQVSHENYGMYMGHDAIPNPVVFRAEEELRQLKRDIENREQWESSTKPCKACTTTGIVKDGWGRDIECMNCSGKGRV